MQSAKSLMFTQVILKYCYTNSCNIILKRRKITLNFQFKLEIGVYYSIIMFSQIFIRIYSMKSQNW